MKKNKLFKNWETKELINHLNFLEGQVWTTKTHYQVHDIKKILKDRKRFYEKIELYKDFF